MGTWIRWWKYWACWRVLIIVLVAMALSFVSAYFLPSPWGLVLLLIICGISGMLIRRYMPDMVETIEKDIEEQEKPH